MSPDKLRPPTDLRGRRKGTACSEYMFTSPRPTPHVGPPRGPLLALEREWWPPQDRAGQTQQDFDIVGQRIFSVIRAGLGPCLSSFADGRLTGTLTSSHPPSRPAPPPLPPHQCLHSKGVTRGGRCPQKMLQNVLIDGQKMSSRWAPP